MKHKCGIVGLWSKNRQKAINLINPLKKLQHRGRESCGITIIQQSNSAENNNQNNNQNKFFKNINGLGMVSEVFDNINNINNEEILSGIGHVRYSTSGKSKTDKQQALAEIQPHLLEDKIAVCHNGNIPNIREIQEYINKNEKSLSQELEYEITNDTLVISDFLIKSINNQNNQENIENILKKLIKYFKYAFCILILTKDELYAVRDMYGYRPLCYGYNSEYESYLLASESVALVNHKLIREIEPGEIIKINKNGVSSLIDISFKNFQKCIFEYIYFANENSTIDEKLIYQFRYNCGKLLAKQETINFNNNVNNNTNTSDFIVIGSPNTGIPGGKGYADELGLPYAQYLRKKPDCGRTFILPNQSDRIKYLNKFDLDKELLKDKKIILVDDSIVRGNTIKSLNRFLKEYANIKELHIRILSPPLKSPCFFGVDIPTKEELIINKMNIPEIIKTTGIESLIYLDIYNLKQNFNNIKDKSDNYCYGCFTGEYIKDISLLF